jgi:hypothetical protein
VTLPVNSSSTNTFTVTNGGVDPLTWTYSNSSSWINVQTTPQPVAGGSLQTVSFQVNSTGLAIGTYTGLVTVDAAGASGTPKTVVVTLEVQTSGSWNGTLDDYEGTMAGGYYNWGSLGYTNQSTTTFEGTHAMQLSLSGAASEGFGGILASVRDLTGYNTIRFRILNDTGVNKILRLRLKDNVAAGSSVYETGDITVASSSSWQTVEVPISSISNYISGTANGLDLASIAEYILAFNSQNPGTIYADYINAVMTTPAGAPRDLALIKSGNNAILSWQAPQAGAPATEYRIYRSTTSSNIVQPGNLLGTVSPSTLTYTNTGAVSTPDDYYYMVTAYSAPTEGPPSHAAYLLKTQLTLAPGAISNMYWCSIPYGTPYHKAIDMVNDINGSNTPGSSGTVIEIGRFDTATGLLETLTWYGDTWWDTTTGDSQGFSIVTGESYYVALVDSAYWIAAGQNNLDFSFDLAPVGTNMFWVSLPYNGDYTNARSIVEHMNQGLAVADYAVVEIGRYNPNGVGNEALTWYGDTWWDTVTGDDQGFAFNPGEGYYISVVNQLNNWVPRRK